MKCVTMVTIALLAAAPVLADREAVGIGDLTTIANDRGAARILFKAPSMDRANIAVSRATLTVAVTGPVAARRMGLRIHPVTTSWMPGGVSWTAGWSRAGGDFDDDLYAWAELDLNRGATDLVFDMTRVVKEIVEEGVFADGFILTVDPGEGVGLPADDVTRFEDLSSASLDVTYRYIHPRRRDANRAAGE